MDDPNDTNIKRNQASGAYSTAMGASNKANIDYSAAIGYNNNLYSGSYTGCKYHYTIGTTNTVLPNGDNQDNSLTIGFSNEQNGKGNFIFGSNNLAKYNSNVANCLLVGRENTARNNKKYLFGLKNTSSATSNIEFHYGCGLSGFSTGGVLTLLGNYNFTSPSLTSPRVIVGCGANGANKNAIEINATDLKILNDLQLASDATTVNAITPPQDPNNVTTYDQTLVTKSHLTNTLGNYAKSQVAYLEDWDTASALPLDNTTVVLPTVYGAIPSWAKRAVLTFRWENELITKEIFFDKNEGIHLHLAQRAYSTFPDTIHYRHLRIEWDFTNQTLLVADYWTYDQDMANAGAISNWDYTLSNASPCKILSVVYGE